ncbi:S49 family peptidase [Geothrix sp. 21YS21S-2]|uniref:S49 family peptidase n=1 Tax=Geothrix sp. 21YS21S-2 TaxID=3068893 RepID=UPI0027BA7C60|nr:S49 family peptidase [Geothrix sp. 21YS21S-2]
MRLADLVYAPWAITPQMHAEVMGIYERHCRGEKIDIRGLEASLGRPLANEPSPYCIEQGVAILPIEGVIAKRMTLLSQISGGASSSYVGQQFSLALQDPNVKAIILAIDSPGGAVDGTQELASLIAGARGTKPVVAFTDGMMASAAYWIGSAADQLFISGDTTLVGSIGVITSHTDQSGAQAMKGMKTTPVTAGKYKAIAHEYAPLSEDGLAMLQGRVDALYTAFVNDVARNRCCDPETVLSDMADGRVFVGKQAIEAGLVDGVSTLDELIAQLSQGSMPDPCKSAGAALQPQPQPQETNVSLTKEQILAEHPEAAAALKAEGRADGATAELARIKAVLAAGLPGHEALINTLAFDGKTTGPEAAMAVLQAERGKREVMARTIEADAPAPLPHATAPAPQAPDAALDHLPLEDRCKAEWEKKPEVREEFGTLDVFTAYMRAEANGQARIFGKK